VRIGRKAMISSARRSQRRRVRAIVIANGTASASVINVVTADMPTVRTSTSRKWLSSITAEY